MTARVGGVTLLALCLAVGLGAQDAWPPPGVLQLNDGVTPPIVATRVNPEYTPAAVRQRIQGVVTVEAVVETNGTVGPARVRRSLNAESGLDAAAVDAVKRWKFPPGLKDGVPVRVLVAVRVAFTLRGAPPVITLPEGFAEATDDDRPWSKSEVSVSGIRMQFEYPRGWQLPDMPAVAVFMMDPRTMRSVGIYRPAPAPRPLMFPMGVPDLENFADTMRHRFGAQTTPAEVLGAGQSAESERHRSSVVIHDVGEQSHGHGAVHGGDASPSDDGRAT